MGAVTGGPGWLLLPGSAWPAKSESVTTTGKPRARRMLPPAETTRGVPTTWAILMMTAWMSSGVTPLSAAAPALAR